MFNLTVVLGAGLLGGLLGAGAARQGRDAAESADDARSSPSTSVRPASGRPSSTATWQIRAIARRPFPPPTPFPGLVEFDAAELCAPRARRRRARRSPRPASRSPPSASRTSGPAPSCGTAAPASRSAPALGWQDLRTVGECMIAAGRARPRAAPPTSRPRSWPWLLANTPGARDRDLAFGTVDSWLAWQLSGGEVHVTDPSNARRHRAPRPRRRRRGTTDVLERARRAAAACCPRLVDTSGVVGAATALPGAPPIAALVGDQQALARRPGLRDARAGQDHVRHRRDPRRVPRRRQPDVGSPRRARLVPDRRLVHRTAR